MEAGEEGGSLAHKTCYCLDLDLKTSEGVRGSRGTDYVSGVASQEDQQWNETFQLTWRLMGSFPLSNTACFYCLLNKTCKVEGSQTHDSEN